MKTDLATIIQCLDRQKLKYSVLQHGKTAVLVLPEYGRVLGCWSDVEKDNHFWLNTNFLNGNSDLNWANPGGHRIWLAPEREFFINDLKRPFETYRVPKEFDPGCYTYKKDVLDVCLENRGHAYAHVSNMNVPFKLSRHIRALKNEEIRSFAADVPLQGAGYEEHTMLELDESCPVRVGIWSLIQVEPGGVVVVPLRNGPRHTVFFGQPNEAISSDGRLLNVHFGQQQKQTDILFKIGLKASWASNTIVYRKDNKDGFSSITVKVFETADDTHYVDTPWQLPEDYGYAVQLFYGARYGFGELESHAPVIKGPSGQWHSVNKCSVYAFCGDTELCNDLIARILQTP